MLLRCLYLLIGLSIPYNKMFKGIKEANQNTTPQKYSLRLHHQQKYFNNKASLASLPISYRKRTEGASGQNLSPIASSSKVTERRLVERSNTQVGFPIFIDDLQSKGDMLKEGQLNHQTPSVLSFQKMGIQQLNQERGIFQTEGDGKVSLRNFKKAMTSKGGSRAGRSYGDAKLPEERHTTDLTQNSQDYRETQTRNSDSEMSKHSLRNKNRKVTRPEVLLNLKFEDLAYPIHMKPSQRLSQPIGPTFYKTIQNNRFCSIRRSSNEGCRGGQPKSYWVNCWLQMVGSSSPHERHLRVKDEKAMEANIKQIERDLHRTQPDHPAFQSKQMIEMLKEVLIGYAQIDEEVGYVQGMNFIAAALVYHCQNIEDSLRILTHMMKVCGYRKLFLGELGLGRTIASKLQENIRMMSHDLYIHLTEEGIQLQIFTSSWYFSLCGSFVPLQSMHIFIDKFLKQRFTGVNELILALLIKKKEQLMELEDSELMLEFSNQKLSDYGEAVNWQELRERSDRLLLTPIQI